MCCCRFEEFNICWLKGWRMGGDERSKSYWSVNGAVTISIKIWGKKRGGRRRRKKGKSWRPAKVNKITFFKRESVYIGNSFQMLKCVVQNNLFDLKGDGVGVDFRNMAEALSKLMRFFYQNVLSKGLGNFHYF